MNRSDLLTDEQIQAAFERRAGRAVPDDLRGLVVAQTGLARQHLSSRVRIQQFFSAARLRPTWVVLLVLASLLGLAVAAAIVGQDQSPAPLPSQLLAGPYASSSPSGAPSPSGLNRPPGVIAFIHVDGRFDREGFSPIANGSDRLWIVNSDGSHAHVLFPDRPGRQFGVAWSADGRRLIFSEGPAQSPGTFTPATNKLYLTDASGAAPTIADTSCKPPCYDDSEAALSPDGTQIVFSRVNAIDVSSPPPVSVLATMDLASGRVIEMESTKLTIPTGGWNGHPRYSPDGTQIVFSRSSDIGGPGSVAVINSDGTNLRLLSLAPQSPRDTDWSPDGSRIVFSDHTRVSLRDSSVVHRNVYSVRPDGTDLRQLTTDDASMAASWTQDGRILFVRAPIGEGAQDDDLWLMDADGRNKVALGLTGVAGSCCAQAVAWQPVP